MTDIVIVGAGYAGLAALDKLKRYATRHDARVTLVSERERFVERLRLHQLATGQHISASPLRDVVAGSPRTRLLHARAKRLETTSSQLLLTDGTAVHFDAVILATGSSAAWPQLPGVKDNAVAVTTREEAERCRNRFTALTPGGTVTVIGGGFVGVETAAEMATQRPDIHVRIMTSGIVGTWLTPRAQHELSSRLTRLGIEIQEHTRVAAVATSSVTTAVEETPSDLTVWAGGLTSSDLAASSGLAVDDGGRMLVDDTLTSLTDPRVVGAGDIVALPGGGPHRMACQTAIPMGWHAAETVRRRIQGHTPTRYRPRFIWSHTSLGRDDCLTQLSHLDDRPLPVWFTGRPAVLLKEAVVKSISR